MSDKAIYSVDTVETITDNDKIYVNTGDNIKQIKSSDLFIDINSNLDSQGLLDVFNDNWKQGMYDVSTGIWHNNTNVCCSAEPMTCKGGDIVTLEYKGTNNGIYIFFYNGDTFLSQLSSTNGYLRTTVPSNVTCFNIEVVNSNITPQTVGHISVYVNNAINEIKNDLGGLSFSVSGTTLSITDGTNTWTLSQ